MKIIRKFALCLSVLAMGLSMGSCNMGDISKVLASRLQDAGTMQVLSTVLKNIAGSTVVTNYTGKATSQTLYSYEDSWLYVNKSQTNSFDNHAVALSVKTAGQAKYGSVTIPAYTDGGATLTAVNLYNLSMDANGKMDICDNSSIDGTLTVNGKTYTAGSLYITKAQQSASGLALEVTIYFSDGKDYTHAVNYTYSGTAVK